MKLTSSKECSVNPMKSLRCTWEVNTRMDLKEIGVYTRSSVDSAQDRGYCRALVNVALDHWVP
jgi:hypothetical protein